MKKAYALVAIAAAALIVFGSVAAILIYGYYEWWAPELYILMYHDIVKSDEDGVGSWTTTEDRFREDLQWLKDHGYTTVLPSELVSGKKLPKRIALITFDDGYASNYNIAYPILKEYGDKAVISIIMHYPAENNPDFLSWEQCREMSESGLVEFGSHTYMCHTNSIVRTEGESREDYEERVFPDIEKSVSLLEENVGVDVQLFAYPHGSVEPWADEFLCETFDITVTTEAGMVNPRYGLYKLPRYNISYIERPMDFLPE